MQDINLSSKKIFTSVNIYMEDKKRLDTCKLKYEAKMGKEFNQAEFLAYLLSLFESNSNREKNSNGVKNEG